MNNNTLTPDEISILQHALGHTRDNMRPQHQNRYIAGPGHAQWPVLEDMVSRDIMIKRKSPSRNGEYIYHVTIKGMQLLASTIHHT